MLDSIKWTQFEHETADINIMVYNIFFGYIGHDFSEKHIIRNI